MFFANNPDNERIHAGIAVKGASYHCYGCGDEVILRKGTVRRAHFAHKSQSSCPLNKDVENYMSEWHIDWQNQFPENDREIIIKNGNEKRRIDVVKRLPYWDNHPYFFYNIIEFQHSHMSPSEFMKRTEFYIDSYNSHCRQLIWVFDFITEYKQGQLYEYEENKWKWKNPVDTFAYYYPQKRTFRRNNETITLSKYFSSTRLFFQIDENCLVQVTWAPESKEWVNRKPTFNYFRFTTSSKRWTKEEFINAINNYQFDSNSNEHNK